MRSCLALVLLPLVVACIDDDHRVRGRIAGERVPLRTSAFVDRPGVYDNGDGQLVMVATDLADTCTPFVEFWRQAEGDLPPDELAAAWAELFPPDFWWVQLELRVENPDVRIDSFTEMTGVPGDRYPEEAGEVWASFVHVTDWLDADYWTGEGLSEDLYGARTDGGVLNVEHHLPGQTFVGQFETVATTDGSDALGEIELDYFSFGCEGLVSGP